MFYIYLDLLHMINQRRIFVKIILLNLYLSCDNIVSIRKEMHLKEAILRRSSDRKEF